MTLAKSNRSALVAESGRKPYGVDISVRRHNLTADEPIGLGGQDYGPDPFEILLSALGACTAMTVRMYADRKGWPLDRVSVRVVQTVRAGGVGGAADRFERTVFLDGELSLEQRARLMEIAARCPVGETLKRGAETPVVAAPSPPEPAV